MKRIPTLVIGAGQAGLAISHALSERAMPHVLLERGEIANSWRTERWDSLRLLTPNWQSRLPGYAWAGENPDGFMDMPQVTRFLNGYADHCGAPVETNTRVTSVTRHGTGYRVQTNRGDWHCQSLFLATGACNRPLRPAFADAISPEVQQVSPLDYKNPAQLKPGGVLVVGASASGVQLAAEIRAAGHPVTLAAGNHIRMPRSYRGRDIQWWMDRSGLLSTTTDQIDDLTRARSVPSLQLVGDATRQFLDLNALQDAGVKIAGRLAGMNEDTALFSGGLANAAKLSDLKMNRALAAFDQWADDQGITGLGAPERFAPTRLPDTPVLQMNLRKAGISTILWATGFAPDFSWLHLPVFDRKGRLAHTDGVVAPSLYVLGLPFLRTRKSSLIDGVGADAQALADHLVIANRRNAA